MEPQARFHRCGPMATVSSRAARRWTTALRHSLLAILAIPLAYLIAAIVGSLVPRNPGWTEPRRGILIFVRTNGVHADIVLPASAGGVDLYRLVPPADIRDPGRAGGWVAFGWGQREFYLETPRWADLTVRNAVRSVLGGDALVHVEHLGQPSISPAARPIRLGPQAYRRLVASMVRYFVLDQARRTIPLRGRGYGPNDIFYEARGRYSALQTSNQWTADRLAEAGVEIGVWTPFAQGILWRFRHEWPDSRSPQAQTSALTCGDASHTLFACFPAGGVQIRGIECEPRQDQAA